MTANDWRPIATAAALEGRAAIVWQIREIFHRHGYAEVHTPTISRDTVIDRYIDPITIAGRALACSEATAEEYFLQTSPEFCMKRLLASGMRAIYQLGPAYRAGERGQFHNPEFTMLEWYRAGETFAGAIAFLRGLADALFATRSPAAAPTEVLSYTEAFQRTLAIDPLQCDDSIFSEVAAAQGVSLGSSWAGQLRDDWLNLLFAECVQPQLGRTGPVIVTHYPASQAALAQVSPSDPRTSERYELFCDGVELANGYHELLDADELVARSQRNVHQRRSDGKGELPSDNQLLAAMRSGLPAACGCALGVDRLVMLLLRKDSIDEVIAFPIERA
ncbi:MAG: EF-P lysine aminoacylase EpmA [Aureliella sp.]